MASHEKKKKGKKKKRKRAPLVRNGEKCKPVKNTGEVLKGKKRRRTTATQEKPKINQKKKAVNSTKKCPSRPPTENVPSRIRKCTAYKEGAGTKKLKMVHWGTGDAWQHKTGRGGGIYEKTGKKSFVFEPSGGVRTGTKKRPKNSPGNVLVAPRGGKRA